MKKLVRINKNRNITITYNIDYFLNPDYVILPNDGKYQENDYIYMGTIIDNNVVSISGTVSKVDNKNIVIENDFKEKTNIKTRKHKITNREELTKLLENNYFLKDKITNFLGEKGIVISAINDNPYVYNRIFLLKEKIKDLLEVINLLSKIYNRDALIAIKSSESFIIDECLNVIGTYPNIKIALINDEYPLNNKEFLLKKLHVPNESLFLNVEDIELLDSLIKGHILTSKLITVSGDALSSNKVIRVKIGTPLDMIINKYIDIKNKNNDIIINGLMNGYKIKSLEDIAVTNNINSCNIMKKSYSFPKECINCGLCELVCPKGVIIRKGKNMDKCIDCGLCSYICPSHINLRKYLNGGNHE